MTIFPKIRELEKRSAEQRKKNMEAVKSKGSKIERTLAQALWKRGARYRKNDKTVFGKPDFTFKGLKIAVFCDSEFWHGKNWERKKHEHKSNISFWHQKIERNIERDKEVNEHLREKGWIVLRFWGNDILKDPESCSDEILKTINERKSK